MTKLNSYLKEFIALLLFFAAIYFLINLIPFKKAAPSLSKIPVQWEKKFKKLMRAQVELQYKVIKNKELRKAIDEIKDAGGENHEVSQQLKDRIVLQTRHNPPREFPLQRRAVDVLGERLTYGDGGNQSNRHARHGRDRDTGCAVVGMHAA